MRSGSWILIGVSLAAARAHAVENDSSDDSLLDTVIVTARRISPTSLPAQIPTTLQSATKEDIEKSVNAADSEDAIKYFPSLLVRKRYIGDYNHAVLSSRASGTGNSARSAVYADGLLLSNYLGNGATYAPRWMLVTPEEIERVDVMYGPFSAAYSGNSVGAVVDFVTSMPEKFEAHAKAAYVSQPFELYNTARTYRAHQESLSLGDRSGKLAWRLHVQRTDSEGQPLTFATKPVSAGVSGANNTPVTGAALDKDRSNNPWYIVGTGAEYSTVQDHAKVKLSYDLAPQLRAQYLLGYWRNDSQGNSQTYLHDANGDPVYSGAVNIDGRDFTIAATDLSLTRERLGHVLHGFSLKSITQGHWDGELIAGLYHFDKDDLRAPSVALPMAYSGGAGTLTRQNGTQWYNLAAKAAWRPRGAAGVHIVDFGYQLDQYRLHILKFTVDDWLRSSSGTLNSEVGGGTRTHALYVQDTWTIARKTKAVIGARVEQWSASGGYTRNGAAELRHPDRDATYVSPKAVLAFELNEHAVIKGSLGRAVRMPTVNELYGATSGVLTLVNDPTLRPEKSWTAELSLEQRLGPAEWRATGFFETVNDSLYTERVAVGGTVVSRVTNIDRIATTGIELALQATDLGLDGLDVSGSVTYADSRIRENHGYVAVPGDTLGKYQPRVPVWRATALLSYRINAALNIAYGARYSGKQYSTLDNSDPNGFAYQAASRYLTTDVRVRYRFASQWTLAAGIDNLNNYRYWNFHPYPQRSYSVELHWDLP